jgi:cell division septation protein DedD
MSLNNKTHSQFELFPLKNQDSGAPSARPRQPINDLTLSVENIIVVCIVLMMSFVLFFSFGVERGRRIASADGQTPAQAAKQQPDRPFVVEAGQTAAVAADAKELASDKEETAEKQEIIQVPIERELTDEQLFTIQVASFKLKSHAEKEAENLGKMGTETFVLPKGSYSIVCVGKFAERAKADQFSRTLKSKYRDLLVRRL